MDFDVDREATYTVDTAIPPGFNPKTEQIIKTYLGLFQTYADLEKRVSPDKTHYLKLGFEHLGERRLDS